MGLAHTTENLKSITLHHEHNLDAKQPPHTSPRLFFRREPLSDRMETFISLNRMDQRRPQTQGERLLPLQST